MAAKAGGGSVVIACALLAFAVLFGAFLVVSCDYDHRSGSQSGLAPVVDLPRSSGSELPHRSVVPPTYDLIPVPLAPESTYLAPAPRRR